MSPSHKHPQGCFSSFLGYDVLEFLLDMPDTSKFLNSNYMEGKSEDISDAAEDTKEYWEEEIEFLEARLRGEQGEIDDEDRTSCEEALSAAKENLASL